MKGEAHMEMADLVHALRLATPADCDCFGCGHEHNCRSDGCALTWKAANAIETLTDKLERVTKERDHALERLKYSNAERDAVSRRMIELEARK